MVLVRCGEVGLFHINIIMILNPINYHFNETNEKPNTANYAKSTNKTQQKKKKNDVYQRQRFLDKQNKKL